MHRIMKWIKTIINQSSFGNCSPFFLAFFLLLKGGKSRWKFVFYFNIKEYGKYNPTSTYRFVQVFCLFRNISNYSTSENVTCHFTIGDKTSWETGLFTFYLLQKEEIYLFLHHPLHAMLCRCCSFLLFIHWTKFVNVVLRLLPFQQLYVKSQLFRLIFCCCDNKLDTWFWLSSPEHLLSTLGIVYGGR